MKIKLSVLREAIQDVLVEMPRYGGRSGPGGRREPWIRGKSAKGVISFPTVTALALWKGEVLGQISDGAWENSGPNGHYHFWHNLKSGLGKAQTTATTYPEKNNYGLSKLIEYVGDRMLKTGQMAKAAGDADRSFAHAADYMPPTLEEWTKSKETGQWKYDFVGKYMEPITPELAKKFYATKYEMPELKRDLALIRSAMKNVVVSGDAETAEPEQVEELPATGGSSAPEGTPDGNGKKYKIYGKSPDLPSNSPAHTRYKGKAYAAKPDTKFKKGESAYVDKTPEGKLKVSKTDDNYSQVWDSEDPEMK